MHQDSIIKRCKKADKEPSLGTYSELDIRDQATTPKCHLPSGLYFGRQIYSDLFVRCVLLCKLIVWRVFWGEIFVDLGQLHVDAGRHLGGQVIVQLGNI